MYLERDGVRLFCEVTGTGIPPLLFVHGWLASHEIWREQVAAFRGEHCVISIDLRGFGRSDKPDVQYTFDLFAEDLDFIIDRLKLNRPILVGWSKGASIGLVYAVRYPQKLSGLVLVGGGAKFIAGDDFPHGLAPEAFDRLLAQFETDYARGVRGFIDAMLPETGTEALKAELYQISSQTPARVALNSIRNDAKYDLRPLLDVITVPTLICYGDQDTICPPAGSETMRARLRHATVCVFRGKGHAPFLTDAEAFNRCLRAFVGGLR